MTAVSLLITVMWVVLTPLSFWRDFHLIRTNAASNVRASIFELYLTIFYQSGPGMPAFIQTAQSKPHSWEAASNSTARHRIEWGLALWPYFRFHYWAPSTASSGAIERRGWFVPTWLLAALFALPSIVRLIRRRRAIPPGCCPRCGYDFRASPDRCPECGAEVKPHAAKGIEQ